METEKEITETNQGFFNGGDTRVRTEDLQHAMLTLYQLSYVPTLFILKRQKEYMNRKAKSSKKIHNAVFNCSLNSQLF